MAAIYVRQATLADLPAIMELIQDAKDHLKSQDVDQWQNGYPDEAAFHDDIEHGFNYVLISDGKIAGTATLFPSPDPYYGQIDHGAWAGDPDEKYVVIHRIAISSQFRGQHLSKLLISNLISIAVLLGYHDIRIDTHPDNKGMQHVITTNGFIYRGYIYMFEDKQPRYAYQLEL
ncbi:GNAT family N-acetyltransferase [Lactobacillus selangorensis]|nr:GNAT family N-acetyltransferase [Lactobacillus selangorensis]